MKHSAVLILLLATLTLAGAPTAVPIQIVVRDVETGRPVAARAYLSCDEKLVLPSGLQAYRKGAEEHFILSGNDTLELNGQECRLRVQRGLEYEPVETSIQPSRDTAVEIRLKRWASMNQAGWYSADMHVHRSPVELPAILMAEDLNFAPTITTHVWSNSESRPFQSLPGFPVRVDETHFFTANSQEVERIQGGPGAVILLGQRLPIPFEGYEFYPPSSYYTSRVHAQGGYVEGDKLFWLDTPVNAALGELDFIELNCNHFLPHDVDTDLVAWSHWPVEMGYRGDRGFTHWMMDSYYLLLNCGFHLPLVAGSASGVKATPVGYNRVYVYLGGGSVGYESLLKAMKAGRTFSTNGPLLDLKINGNFGPGSTLALNRGEIVRIEVSVRSRRGLESVELILNGKPFRSYLAGGQKELSIQEELVPDRSSWIALRAFETSERTVIFGHTSPAYLIVDDRPIADPGAARALASRIDDLIDYTLRKVAFREASHQKETIELYRRARAVYETIASGHAER